MPAPAAYSGSRVAFAAPERVHKADGNVANDIEVLLT